MNKNGIILHIFFEDPFWIGVFERQEDGRMSVCKVTFGSEPRDTQVYDFLLREFYHLKFSPEVTAPARREIRNPKRAQRAVHRQMEHTGLGTKSQQALQLQREQEKAERKETSKARREVEARLKFERKQQKRREKHRGR